MIITVPEYKRIFKTNRQYNKLNEDADTDYLFDNDDIFDDDDEECIIANKVSLDYEKEELAPKVEAILNQLEVENYEFEYTGHGIIVNVHDNLYLSNKHLDRYLFAFFNFGQVDGSCNYTGNNLTDWSKFPEVILGNCYANFNNIKTFDGAPAVNGKMVATRQNHKTTYPLTDLNFRKIKYGYMTENSVYAISANRFGKLYSICESDNSCIIKFNDNTKLKFKLNDVEYLGNLENLFIN